MLKNEMRAEMPVFPSNAVQVPIGQLKYAGSLRNVRETVCFLYRRARSTVNGIVGPGAPSATFDNVPKL